MNVRTKLLNAMCVASLFFLSASLSYSVLNGSSGPVTSASASNR